MNAAKFMKKVQNLHKDNVKENEDPTWYKKI